jgi:hypothetical protein
MIIPKIPSSVNRTAGYEWKLSAGFLEVSPPGESSIFLEKFSWLERGGNHG